jgi:hypothetical protein
VYREDLEHHPHNGWALFGLKSALEAQGDVPRQRDTPELRCKAAPSLAVNV